MQKINFEQVITDLAGKPAQTKAAPNDPPVDLTLRGVCIEALGGPGQIKVEEKIQRTLLAEKIFENKEPELTVEELAMLKKLVGENVNHFIICTKALRLLDPPVPEKESETKDNVTPLTPDSDNKNTN